jgi:hypothetical protein
MNIDFGTGRIAEIINTIQQIEKKEIKNISAEKKLEYLCFCLQMPISVFDNMITQNPPVLRTIKGHVFEVYFDNFMIDNGIIVDEAGGDTPVDRIVNNYSLQIKTPTEAGTSGDIVQFKTHKTHGAKSEAESLSYYHKISEFAEFLVGLVSYNPLNILIIKRDEIPTHPEDGRYICSPFFINWRNHPGLNNFSRIGIKKKLLPPVISSNDYFLLPECSNKLGVPSSYIIDAILKENNFRIWDMSIRGFARETIYENVLKNNQLKFVPPAKIKAERADKADHAVLTKEGYKLLQMKGLSINNCVFSQTNPVIGVETQLTRGRVNDHPTQSRLYYITDFDYLVIGIDPPITSICHKCCGFQSAFEWEFYTIPTDKLQRHKEFSNRLNALQKFSYMEIQQYKMSDNTFKH